MPQARVSPYYLSNLHLLTKYEILVFLYLIAARNGEDGRCNPRLRTIAQAVNLAPSHVSRAVTSLEEKQWVIWDEKGCFQLAEKVTKLVSKKVTKLVSKKATRSYQNGMSKLPKRYVEDTNLVTRLNKDIELSIELSNELVVAKATADDATSSQPEKTEHQRLMDHHYERLGGKVFDGGGQGRAVKQMLKAGISPADCLTCYDYQLEHQKAGTGWRNGVSWLTVQGHVGEWIVQGKPATPLSRKATAAPPKPQVTELNNFKNMPYPPVRDGGIVDDTVEAFS